MKVIYVAGKYSAENEAEVKRNIAIAEAYAQKIWLSGHAAICPHLNTAHWGNLLTHEQFITGDLAIIKKCDAVFLLQNWRESKGALQENEFAKENSIPCFDYLPELFDWADGRWVSI